MKAKKVIKKPMVQKEIIKPIQLKDLASSMVSGVVKKQAKAKQKTGTEIIKIYETLKESGVTPEDAVFYLMIHMDKLKAKEIGMDMSDSTGHSRKIVVSILGDEPEEKFATHTTSMVA